MKKLSILKSKENLGYFNQSKFKIYKILSKDKDVKTLTRELVYKKITLNVILYTKGTIYSKLIVSDLRTPLVYVL
jgi:hypothetical protein